MSEFLSPAALIALWKALIVALVTRLPQGISQLSLDGKLMSLADVLALVKEYLGIYEAVPTSHSLWRSSLATRNQKSPAAQKFASDLRAALKTVVGKRSEDLTEFGFKPEKVAAAPTLEEKADRVKKNLATRQARHTMGKRQKEKLHGDGAPPTPKA